MSILRPVANLLGISLISTRALRVAGPTGLPVADTIWVSCIAWSNMAARAVSLESWSPNTMSNSVLTTFLRNLSISSSGTGMFIPGFTGSGAINKGWPPGPIGKDISATPMIRRIFSTGQNCWIRLNTIRTRSRLLSSKVRKRGLRPTLPPACRALMALPDTVCCVVCPTISALTEEIRRMFFSPISIMAKWPGGN